jgi:hypothetical protein
MTLFPKYLKNLYHWFTGDVPTEEQVEKVVQDVEKYASANHLFWGLWGIISVSIPTSRFNLNYKHERVK